MRLLSHFIKVYPGQTALMLLALLLAGVAEGVSLSALLPLVTVALEREKGGEAVSGPELADTGGGFEQTVRDVLLGLGITPTIGVLLAIIVVGITLKNGLVLLARKQIGYTAARVTTDLRLSLLRALLDSRWAHFLRQPVGRLANSMATESMRAAEAYVHGTTLIARLIEASVYTVIALLVSWQATLAALGAGVIVLFVTHALVKMSRTAGKRQTKLMISLLSRLTDTLQSVKPLKAMAREELAGTVLESETSKLNRALRKEVFSKALMNSGQNTLVVGVVALGMYVAFVHFDMGLATLMVLVVLLGRLLGQIGSVQRWYQKMVTSESAFWSLQGVIEEAKLARETSTGSRSPALESEIRLDRIGFAYREKPVLKELSLTIPSGGLTTLVGPSGAGKTTVVDLVTGLHSPQSGTVLLDQTSLAEIDLKAWRRMIGYVPQENLLLHDTIYNNVTLSDPALTQDDVDYALRAAGAWDFVQDMPEGMFSLVGERGAQLSGGQRQRIMIARALAHRPKLLILDEATSALDPRSEQAICETLGKLRGEHTILAISHQPALVNAADRVYRLQQGIAQLVSKEECEAAIAEDSEPPLAGEASSASS